MVTAPGTGSGGACTRHSGPKAPALHMGVGSGCNHSCALSRRLACVTAGARFEGNLASCPCPPLPAPWQACRLLAQSWERSPDMALSGLFSWKQIPTGTHSLRCPG